VCFLFSIFVVFSLFATVLSTISSEIHQLLSQVTEKKEIKREEIRKDKK